MLNNIATDFIHHATMLHDHHRLKQYNSAIIEIVGNKDHVVDIGSGTGILSALAKKAGAKEVSAIEYFENTSKMSEELLRYSKINGVTNYNSSSFEHKSQTPVDHVITETIGSVGPEENIVEICHDFKTRHPEIKSFIPSQLSLFSQALKAPAVGEQKKSFLNAFKGNSLNILNFSEHIDLLEQKYCESFYFSKLSEARSLNKAQEMCKWTLGESSHSNFSFSTLFPKETDALHIYFECKLSEKESLSSAFNKEWTHWRHAYLIPPRNATQCHIEYKSTNRKWAIKWN